MLSGSPALRLSVLGIFRDIAQDEFRKPYNQLFETRNFLPALRQLALFICHYRRFIAVPSRKIHAEPLSNQVSANDGSGHKPKIVTAKWQFCASKHRTQRTNYLVAFAQCTVLATDLSVSHKTLLASRARYRALSLQAGRPARILTPDLLNGRGMPSVVNLGHA